MPEFKAIAKRTKKPQNGWIIARKVTQAIAFLVFLVTLFLTRNNSLSYTTLSIPERLSPLTMLASLISSRTFLVGMTLSLVLVVLSLTFGRAWCGWLCPLGTILDVFKFKNRKSVVPEKLRTLKYALLIIILVAAIFSNLTLLFLDPLTIFTRSFTISILPVLDSMITAVERFLVTIAPLRDVVLAFDALIRPAVFPAEPVVFQYSIVFSVFLAGIILLNLVAERFWCRYICPLGGLLGFFSKLALFKRQVKESCVSCALCKTYCPTSTIDPDRGFESDPSECTMCMNCLESCRKDSVTFAPKLSLAKLREYDPNRRSILRSALISITAVALLSVEWIKRIPQNFRLRPPGVDDEDKFTATCIRCGLCMKVCPTHGLQPDMIETGISNVSTPILIPRHGFCQYSCNACGQICPVGAIPALPLEEKKQLPIGKAYIDHNRCIAWSDHRSCIVCEEMCPLPEKAITLEIGEFTSPEGEKFTLQLPVVNRLTCIGCGTCEFKCPVSGDAAIRVYTL